MRRKNFEVCFRRKEMKSLFKNEQSGRSMVEMLGVLAIIGVLSVGGISGYSKAMAKFKLTKAQDQLSMMIMNIRTAFATSPGYPGLTTRNAIDYKLVSQEMVVAGSTSLINAFGGDTIVEAINGADGTPNGAFQIVFSGLGKDVCVSLATSDWGTDGLIGIGVASTKISKITGTPSAAVSFAGGGSLNGPKALPLSISDVRKSNACGSDNTNSITWVYN